MNYQSGGIKRITALLLAGAMSAAAFAAESKERTIVFNEDRNQHYMTTKTYELRHIRAHDILPFIKGAIKRFDDQSTIQSLDYAAGKKTISGGLHRQSAAPLHRRHGRQAGLPIPQNR